MRRCCRHFPPYLKHLLWLAIRTWWRIESSQIESLSFKERFCTSSGDEFSSDSLTIIIIFIKFLFFLFIYFFYCVIFFHKLCKITFQIKIKETLKTTVFTTIKIKVIWSLIWFNIVKRFLNFLFDFFYKNTYQLILNIWPLTSQWKVSDLGAI